MTKKRQLMLLATIGLLTIGAAMFVAQHPTSTPPGQLPTLTANDMRAAQERGAPADKIRRAKKDAEYRCEILAVVVSNKLENYEQSHTTRRAQELNVAINQYRRECRKED